MADAGEMHTNKSNRERCEIVISNRRLCKCGRKDNKCMRASLQASRFGINKKKKHNKDKNNSSVE